MGTIRHCPLEVQYQKHKIFPHFLPPPAQEIVTEYQGKKGSHLVQSPLLAKRKLKVTNSSQIISVLALLLWQVVIHAEGFIFAQKTFQFVFLPSQKCFKRPLRELRNLLSAFRIPCARRTGLFLAFRQRIGGFTQLVQRITALSQHLGLRTGSNHSSEYTVSNARLYYDCRTTSQMAFYLSNLCHH